jgi:nitrite reductase/ring-hydroxylating ferredoxin subunit
MTQRQAVARIDAVPAGTGRTFVVNGISLAVFNLSGRVFAIDAFCPHAGVPLTKESLLGTIVSGLWHGSTFDVTSGAVLDPPATEGVRSYPTFVNDGVIEVEL